MGFLEGIVEQGFSTFFGIFEDFLKIRNTLVFHFWKVIKYGIGSSDGVVTKKSDTNIVGLQMVGFWSGRIVWEVK